MKLLIFSTFTLLLAGCSLAPNYETPVVCEPEEWKEEIAADSTPIPFGEHWWSIFNDPCLDALEEIALSQNPSIEIAYQRILEAESFADQEHARFFPFVTLTPFGASTGTLYDPSQFGVPLSPFRAHFQEYGLPFMATYELDLFGKIRNGYYAAQATNEARIFAYQGVKLTLTTDVALTYFRIRSLDAQCEILKQTIQSRQEDVEIVTSRYEGGLVNASDISRAKNELALAQAELSNQLLERAKSEHLLAALLGFCASDYTIAFAPLSGIPPAVCPSLPSELLQKRPDVQEAGRIIAAENARIGIARSEFFPSIGLTGVIGLASPTISSLLDWQARLWAWAINASQMIFDAGKTSALNREAKAHFLQAVAEYTKTTLRAFQEVESALAAGRYTHDKFVSYQKAVEAATDTKSISLERYLNGLFNYLEVADANRSMLSSQLLMERARFETYQASIELVKALGGGYLESSDCQCNPF